MPGEGFRPSLATVVRPGCLTVSLHPADPDLMQRVAAHLQSGGSLATMMRVSVAGVEPDEFSLPGVSGCWDLFEDGFGFTPHFPFQPGLPLQVGFTAAPLGGDGPALLLAAGFSVPDQPRPPPATVQHVFPSGDCLPENLLRFQIRFSGPMQRGRAEAELSIVDAEGSPVPDVLYRAPVELWDGAMQCLTVLLDPGRLKRGVGPNRALGPPLQSGRAYALSIEKGMTDLHGNRLQSAVLKPFSVAAAVREPIAPGTWMLAPPRAGTSQALVLGFPNPLDQALLSRTMSVLSPDGPAVAGTATVDPGEIGWRFTPASPWRPGRYRVRVAPALEDVCGNTMRAAFDRPLRDRMGGPPAPYLLPFEVN